jgi:hypothetical protein
MDVYEDFARRNGSRLYRQARSAIGVRIDAWKYIRLAGDMHVSDHFRHGRVAQGALAPHLEMCLIDPSHEEVRRRLNENFFVSFSPLSIPDDEMARTPISPATVINQGVLSHR